MKDFINLLRESEKVLAKTDWIESLRIFSESRFRKQGFPLVKNDEWIYTKTFPIEQSNFIFNYSTKIVEEENTFLFNNSTISYGNLEEGIEVIKIEDVKNDNEFLNKIIENEKDYIFTNLNYSFFNQGLVINIKKNLKKDVKLIYNLEKGFCTFLFILINIKENLNVSIIEKTSSEENSFGNSLSKVYLSKNSSLTYYKIQKEKGFKIDNSNFFLEKKSNLKIFTISQGSKILRNNLNIALEDEYSNVDAYSLYYCKENQHIDNNTVIEHLVPNCTSNQLYKGVLEGKSNAAFTGKIFVAKDAQKTDASQLNKTLLLSDRAEMNTRPQLQIEADDVKCSHGATIGQLNKEELFYLETRGINKIEAMKILSNAFIEDILGKIKKDLHDEIKEIIL